MVEEHTKEMLGLEEVYVVLSGRALFTIDDEALDAPAGTAVFVRDPARENEDFSSLRERADWPLA